MPSTRLHTALLILLHLDVRVNQLDEDCTHVDEPAKGRVGSHDLLERGRRGLECPAVRGRPASLIVLVPLHGAESSSAF